MACAACGKETKAGVLFCAGCLSGLTDPLELLPRLIDPTADARLQRTLSVSMRVFPTNGPSLSYGPCIDAPLRLPALMEHERISAFPSFVDDYLAGAGVGDLSAVTAIGRGPSCFSTAALGTGWYSTIWVAVKSIGGGPEPAVVDFVRPRNNAAPATRPSPSTVSIIRHTGKNKPLATESLETTYVR